MEPRIPDEQCAAGRKCRWNGRWICSQGASWTTEGTAPWGDPGSVADRLRLLASMTVHEHRWLAQLAEGHLDDGYWQGYESPNGGFEDGPPWSGEERAWRIAARDFMERRAAGDWQLTEGMLMGASYDLCRELAWVRGWCPGAGGLSDAGNPLSGG